jgi:transcription elongation factor Elf1
MRPCSHEERTRWVPTKETKSRKEFDSMPPEFYITCPKCGHRYNVHKMIYDEGEEFSMFCPVCMARYPRKEGKIDAANFEIKK